MVEYRIVWGKSSFLTGFDTDSGIPLWDDSFDKARVYHDLRIASNARRNAVKDFPYADKAINIVTLVKPESPKSSWLHGENNNTTH